MDILAEYVHIYLLQSYRICDELYVSKVFEGQRHKYHAYKMLSNDEATTGKWDRH